MMDRRKVAATEHRHSLARRPLARLKDLQTEAHFGPRIDHHRTCTLSAG